MTIKPFPGVVDYSDDRDILQELKHDIQKRQSPPVPDFLAGLWQIPLFYKACTLTTGLGSAVTGPLYAKSFAPFAKATAPVVPAVLLKKLKIGVKSTTPLLPYSLMKKFFLGVCPPLSVLSWFFASGVNPAPGV